MTQLLETKAHLEDKLYLISTPKKTSDIFSYKDINDYIITVEKIDHIKAQDAYFKQMALKERSRLNELPLAYIEHVQKDRDAYLEDYIRKEYQDIGDKLNSDFEYFVFSKKIYEIKTDANGRFSVPPNVKYIYAKHHLIKDEEAVWFIKINNTDEAIELTKANMGKFAIAPQNIVLADKDLIKSVFENVARISQIGMTIASLDSF